ncbi:MAG TPA: hypothetical protein VFK06_01600 [Candidatus Angelobacter sp.]|nr:hypothetical protein [Candidatus Angelobacter sp.]
MRVLTLLLLCLTAFAQQTAAPANDAQANQQKARHLLDQMITALGGQAYLTVEDSHIEGRTGVFYHGASEGGDVFVRFWQWPGKERWDHTKQRDIITLYVDDRAYERTFRGTKELNPEKDADLRRFMLRRRYTLEIVLRQWLSAPGTALFYEGPALTENHSVERVTVINKNDEAVTLLIDADSHLPVKKTFISRDPQTRDRDEIGEIYDNWKKVQGVTTPYNTLITFNGDLFRQYFISSVTYNSHLQPSLFDPGTMNFDPKKK